MLKNANHKQEERELSDPARNHDKDRFVVYPKSLERMHSYTNLNFPASSIHMVHMELVYCLALHMIHSYLEIQAYSRCGRMNVHTGNYADDMHLDKIALKLLQLL